MNIEEKPIIKKYLKDKSLLRRSDFTDWRSKIGNHSLFDLKKKIIQNEVSQGTLHKNSMATSERPYGAAENSFDNGFLKKGSICRIQLNHSHTKRSRLDLNRSRSRCPDNLMSDEKSQSAEPLSTQPYQIVNEINIIDMYQ